MGKYTKIPCPICKRKGLHNPAHPHAYGWKDHGIVVCRWCNKRFDPNKLDAYLEQERARLEKLSAEILSDKEK